MATIGIIGNGIAGVTAALNIRKRTSHEIVLISKETKYFYSRTALMYLYMGQMNFEDTMPYEPFFWSKNGISLVQDEVVDVDPSAKTIAMKQSGTMGYDTLIIASGSRPLMLNWPGSNLKGVQGLYSIQDLEELERNTADIQTAVVVGGGLIGVELVEMLLSRGISVHFLIRDTHFWGSVLPKEDAEFIQAHFEKQHGLTLHFNEELHEIKGEGRVQSVVTKEGLVISTEFVGITIGVQPNIDFLKEIRLKTERGIVVNEYLETSVSGIYAIGDCAQVQNPLPGRRSMEQVWYTGRTMGETVAKTITGTPTKFNPGIWFNSAKFFDIEYQTYGQVPATIPENWCSFVWQQSQEHRLLHFVFDRQTERLVGVNAFGIRLRHALIEHWIEQETSMEDVLRLFRSANFDPEFTLKYEPLIIDAFNRQFNRKVRPGKKVWWRNLIRT